MASGSMRASSSHSSCRGREASGSGPAGGSMYRNINRARNRGLLLKTDPGALTLAHLYACTIQALSHFTREAT
eukprot:1161439-Pelagomonas_calceolata.AAC.7